jgi:CheY-like chemotaxis protein
MSDRDPSDLRGIRVLVVDDDADNCEVLVAMLEHSGAHVVTACTAADAFSAFEKETPHVLVSDIGLPDEDGFALLRRVRALPSSRGGNVPAIALTGYSHLERMHEDVRGFQAQLTKPINVDQMLAAIAQAVR